MPHHHRTASGVVALLCAVAVLAGCGDDGGTDDAGAEESSATPGSPSATEFCSAALAIELAPEPQIPETATGPEIVEAVASFAGEVLRPLADDVVATAPPSVGDEVAVLSGAVDELAGGNLEAMDAPDVVAATATFDDLVDEECGWGSVVVTATDYELSGMPTQLDAGPTRIRLVNEGQEAHEVLLLRRNPGTEQSVDDLLALSQEEAMGLVTPAGAPAFAFPGDQESVVLDLEPGRYIAICLIPTGIVDETSVPAPDALPHAAHGMVVELTVS